MNWSQWQRIEKLIAELCKLFIFRAFMNDLNNSNNRHCVKVYTQSGNAKYLFKEE